MGTIGMQSGNMMIACREAETSGQSTQFFGEKLLSLVAKNTQVPIKSVVAILKKYQ